ncbi:MAG: hypothetical protein CMI60_09370 [Parvibaculum sp.]|nr:hypothetical protein [Parvibaculum sp.]
MSFLLGVAGGFGQALADDQRDKNEWLRNQKLMNKRYAMTTGTASLKKAQQERDAVLRQADYIQKRGITKSSLMYLWDEGGVNAISDIYDLIQNTHKDATKEEINNLANAAKDYAVNENRSFADVLSKSRGLYSQEMPERKDQTALQKIFGDPTDQAFYDDGTKYEGGYTITDMYRIQGSGFEGGTGSVVFDTDAAPMKRSPQYDATLQRSLLNSVQEKLTLNKQRLQVFDPEILTAYNVALDSAVATDDYSKVLNDEVLRPYAISILQPYLDAEAEVKGSVLNNDLIGSSLKDAIRKVRAGDFEKEEELVEVSIDEQIKKLVSENEALKDAPIISSREEAQEKFKNGTLPEGDFFYVKPNGEVIVTSSQDMSSDSGSTKIPTDEAFADWAKEKYGDADSSAPYGMSAEIDNEQLIDIAKRETKVISLGEKPNPYFEGKTEITYEEWSSIGYKLPAFYRTNPGIPRNNAAWDAAPASRWIIKTK